MNVDIRITGYTSVVFVMNLRPLVQPECSVTFEKLRGLASYNRFLRQTLPEQMKNSPFFEPLLENGELERPMSPEEAGFLTGIFRTAMLDTYSAPCYRVRQAELYKSLDPRLIRNHQFLQANAIFRHWDVFMRPTPMGMFVFRFQRRYKRPTELLTVVQDVLDLQRPLDIPSAFNKRRELIEQLGEAAAATDNDVASINRLLEWARVAKQQQRTNYPPLQSLFGLEIALQFLSTVGRCFQMDDGSELRFIERDADITPPIHDSYVIHHIDEMSAPRSVVQQINQTQRRPESAETAAATAQIDVRPPTNTNPAAPDTFVSLRRQHIRDSVYIRSSLLHLTEGALLRRQNRDKELISYFPDHQITYIDHILAQDKATWAEELCLLTARVAIIMPSYKSRKDELFISTLPGSDNTSGVSYPSYWEALERMIEFVVEGRLMSQLAERLSTDLLDEFVESLGTARSGMAVGDIQIDHAKFARLADEAANIGRLVGMSYGMTNPHLWSRAEYAIEKANHLIEQMQIATLLNHAELNVNNLTSLVNHVDELYLADLSEKNNKQTFWLSLLIASVSFSITLFSLPSFWADTVQLSETLRTNVGAVDVLNLILGIGNFVLGPLLILGIPAFTTYIFIRQFMPNAARLSQRIKTKRNRTAKPRR